MPQAPRLDNRISSEAAKRQAGFSLARSAKAAKSAKKGGEADSIFYIASTRASQSEANTFAYSAAKGVVVALTHALAVSLGPAIRGNCISPGWIETRPDARHSEADRAQHPCGRVGVPQDIAELAEFLLDTRRSGFITGQNFTVDGGMSVKMIYVE